MMNKMALSTLILPGMLLIPLAMAVAVCFFFAYKPTEGPEPTTLRIWEFLREHHFLPVIAVTTAVFLANFVPFVYSNEFKDTVQTAAQNLVRDLPPQRYKLSFSGGKSVGWAFAMGIIAVIAVSVLGGHWFMQRFRRKAAPKDARAAAAGGGEAAGPLPEVTQATKQRRRFAVRITQLVTPVLGVVGMSIHVKQGIDEGDMFLVVPAVMPLALVLLVNTVFDVTFARMVLHVLNNILSRGA